MINLGINTDADEFIAAPRRTSRHPRDVASLTTTMPYMKVATELKEKIGTTTSSWSVAPRSTRNWSAIRAEVYRR